MGLLSVGSYRRVPGVEDAVWRWEAARVTQKGGVMALESPDGKSIYYTKTEGPSSLWKVPIDGGEETQVLESVARRSFAVVEQGNLFHFIAVHQLRLCHPVS